LLSIRSIFSFYIGNFLHLLKNRGSRFLMHAPVIRYKNRTFDVSSVCMSSILSLVPVFSDLSSTGKMRGNYVIALFRVENVIQLFACGARLRRSICCRGYLP
jgi:hypothetical protein